MRSTKAERAGRRSIAVDRDRLQSSKGTRQTGVWRASAGDNRMQHALCALLLLTSTVLAADMSPVPHLPVTRWRVEGGPDDRVQLSSTGGVLVIDYDVEVTDWHKTGHQTLKQKSVKLLLAEPVPLPARKPPGSRQVWFPSLAPSSAAAVRSAPWAVSAPPNISP